MSLFVVVRKKRTCVITVTITDANGVNVVIDSEDQIRIKIGRDTDEPILDLTSKTPTTNGTTVERANPSDVRFDQDDLDFSVGMYDIEAAVVDDDDDDAIKHADNGVFALLKTQLGALTL